MQIRPDNRAEMIDFGKELNLCKLEGNQQRRNPTAFLDDHIGQHFTMSDFLAKLVDA